MKTSDSVAELEVAYGKAKWLNAMVALSPIHAQTFGQMVKTILAEGALPLKIKHFLLFIIYVVKGYEPLARLHAEAAKRTGATSEEWHEVLFAGVLSRGVMVYVEGARILGLGEDISAKSNTENSLSLNNTGQILLYFKETYGSVPPFVELLAKTQQHLLEAYHKARSEILKDAVLPRKYKELLLFGLNAAERYHFGMEIHAKGALDSGATNEELLETMTTSVLGGGIPALVEAATVYLKLTQKRT